MTAVWDRQTRILHWINAILIIALVVLNKEVLEAIGVEEEAAEPVERLHVYIGYVFLVTLTLRIIWGFLGNRYARWSDIIPYGRERWRGIAANIRWYLSGFRGKPAPAIGHDPLASIFYTVLFVVLLAQAATGLTLAGTEYGFLPGRTASTESYAPENREMEEYEAAEAPAAGEAEEEGALEEAAEEVHEFGFYFMLFFIAAHMAGLVVHEVTEKKGLFSSMISGVKYLPKEEGG